MKKFFTYAVVIATFAWSIGLAGLVPSASAAYTPVAGDLIKLNLVSAPGVYYVGTDLKKHLFSNRVTFGTWYDDFTGLKKLTSDEFQSVALGDDVIARAGVLVKMEDSNQIYAVTTGGKLCKVTTDDAGKALFGTNYASTVNFIQTAFAQNYQDRASCDLTAASNLPDGFLIKYASAPSDKFYVEGGLKRPITAEGFLANKFKDSKVYTVPATMTYSAGASLSSLEAAVSSVTTKGGSVNPPAVNGNVTVSLAAGTPASGTLVAGQAIADLAHFTVTNTGSSEAKVTTLKFKRIGVSADATLSSIYLYEGANRLTDGASVSSGNISFNDASGIIVLPAGGSKTISVRANILTGTSGQTIGVAYVNADSSLVSGNLMSIATATLGTASFAATTYPGANSSLDPQNDFVLWENTVNVGTTIVNLQSIRFKQIGSINSNDIKNFRLYVDGNQKSSVAALDANGYVTFDLTAAPVALNTGNRTIKVMVDIIGGSTRTAQLSVRMAADVMAVDTQYGQPILVQANSTTFSARDAGAQTISGGTLSITKKSDSPSGSVTNGSTGVTMAKFELKASGEKMKVESLRFFVTESDGDTAFTLRNGAIFADGVQVGSTAAIAAATDATLGYTEFTFGSSLIVTPGTPVVLSVVADIYDNDGTNDVADADTLKIQVDNSSASNVLKMTSSGYDSVPAVDVPANQLTVSQGNLTVAKNTSYGSRTSVAPKTAYKLGSFSIAATTVEKVNLNTISLDFDTVADAADASSDLSNLYVVYGGVTSTVKTTVADTGNSWSISKELTSGQSITVDVYADVASSITDGDGTADTIRTDLTVTAQTVGSSVSLTPTEVQGQVITWGAGTFTPSFGNSPLSYATPGDMMVAAGDFKFTALNESYTIKEIDVFVDDSTVASAIRKVHIFDGTTDLTPSGFDLNGNTNTSALVTGLSVPVSAGDTKTLTIKFDLNAIGTGYGATGQNVHVASIDNIKYADSQGVETIDTSAYVGNTKDVIVFRTIPTVAAVDLTNSTLVNGAALDLYKFTITPDVKGSLALKQIKLPISWSNGGTTVGDTLELESMKLLLNGVDYSSAVTMTDEDGNTVEGTSGLLEGDDTLVIVFTNELDISAATTFTIKGTPQGFRMTGADTTGDSVSMYLAGDATSNTTKYYLNDHADDGIYGLHTAATGGETAYNFIWSDYGVTPHLETDGASSADWHNGYLIKNLDLNGETWTK
ncbi:MAG: hypothetical protein WC516_00615 [Patescibacteria group bacterium]